MDLAEAVKKVKADKIKDNFMVLEFSYDNKLILPHKDGISILSALANAERLQDPYGGPKRITEVERDLVTTKLMSNFEYERYKIAALLQITPDEVKEMMEAANKPTPSVTP